MKATTAVLAVLATTFAAAQTTAPTLASCGAANVFSLCWSTEQVNRVGCTPPGPGGTMEQYYGCLCKSSGVLVQCFEQCRDSPDYAGQRQTWVNDQASNCRAAGAFAPTTTTTSSSTSATGVVVTVTATATPTGKASSSSAGPVIHIGKYVAAAGAAAPLAALLL
ncbi:hypothetical protein BC828DRAFT_383987 [Blastocladiella britannica]|nr:hypothetical protein BC828DRAFT_383987 [Blastocladiella britannica]